MSFKRAFKNGFKTISTADLANMHTNFNRAIGTRSLKNGVGSDDKSEIAAYSSGGSLWVSASINQKITDLQNIEYYFIDKKGERVDDSKLPDEIALPFKRGYAGMSFSQIVSIAGAREDLSGNDIWIKTANTKYGELNGIPDTFLVVPAGCWKMRRKPDGLGIMSYVVTYNGNQKEYLPEQVIHFKRNAIIDPFVGIGLIAQSRLTVETELVSAEYQLNFYEKDGSPNMVVIDKNMNDPVMAKSKGQQFRDNYEKGLYQQSIMYLFGDVDAKALNISAKDMDYVANKIQNQEAIISIMESTPSVLGLEGKSGNRAVSITATNNYYKKVNSRAQHLCDVLNLQHVWAVDPRRDYTLTYSAYATGDIEDVSRAVNEGIITRNEAKTQLGYDVDKNDAPMNTIYINRAFAPINQVFEGLGGVDSQEVKKNFSQPIY